MQERYLGDSHDFIKYALLRHLSDELDLQIGVNWYLTRPEHVDRSGNNDGEKCHHLKGGTWRSLDPDLFDKISGFEDPNECLISRVAEWGLLPRSTAYHSENISSHNRSDWHRNSMRALSECGLIFLDPDNGFEVPSMSRRTAPKYALYLEAADFARRQGRGWHPVC